MLNKAIFIDRDGVINKWEEPIDKDYGPNWYCLSWDDFEFLPGVIDAFKLINETDYIVVVVSNQSCIGKGYIDYATIINLFSRMKFTIMKKSGADTIAATYFCPHDTDVGCACRKPSPGMLYQAAIEHDIDLSQSWMIGDSDTDIEAGCSAGIPNNKLIRIGDVDYNLITNNVEYNRALPRMDLLEAVKRIIYSDANPEQVEPLPPAILELLNNIKDDALNNAKTTS